MKLFLLGSPYIEIDEQRVEVKRRKALALLAYLAITADTQRRETLATLLWPDSSHSRGRASLSRELTYLNNLIGRTWLAGDRETIGIHNTANLWLDVDAFQQLLAACQTHNHANDAVCSDCLPLLSQASDLYRADFLTGFTLSDCSDFDEWQFFQTESLRQSLISVLTRLVALYNTEDNVEAAIPQARRWLTLDPLHELAHQVLIRLYAQAGQQAAALRQYQVCVEMLETEFGASPAEETTILYEQIRKRVVGRVVGEESGNDEQLHNRASTGFPPFSNSSTFTRRHSLPAQTTAFVSRAKELTAVGTRLADPTCRLLTLIGPGGAGKTRLALETAASQLKHFQHGVFFVALAPLENLAAIPFAIAEALRFTFYEGGTAEQQLLDYLREKSILLILDNFEHILAGVGLVSNILAAAPNLKIVATSRTRLAVQSEHLYQVSGMQFPAAELTTDADILSYSAIALFVQSARQLQADFTLNNENVGDVIRICQLVQGMPLGIVLAASWITLLSPAEIMVEISHSLDFLAVDLHDLPTRQRSLRAVFDHSWRLLKEEEQTVFQQLSVFNGGFTHEATQVVAGASLQNLMALVNRSLLGRTSSGRYEIHELLRQYAAEQLEQVKANSEAARDRHCAYYALFVHHQEADLKSAYQAKSLNRT